MRVQEKKALIEALRKYKAYKPDKSTLLTWLSNIVNMLNKCVDEPKIVRDIEQIYFVIGSVLFIEIDGSISMITKLNERDEMTFGQKVDTTMGIINTVISQLEKEVELHLNAEV